MQSQGKYCQFTICTADNVTWEYPDGELDTCLELYRAEAVDFLLRQGVPLRAVRFVDGARFEVTAEIAGRGEWHHDDCLIENPEAVADAAHHAGRVAWDEYTLDCWATGV